jgi:hypothetical protein
MTNQAHEQEIQQSVSVLQRRLATRLMSTVNNVLFTELITIWRDESKQRETP